MLRKDAMTFEDNPDLANMFANLDDPLRTVSDAIQEATEAITDRVVNDTGIMYLIEEIVRRTMDRPPMLDESGEDREYWNTRTLVTMKLLGGVIDIMYHPYEGK